MFATIAVDRSLVNRVVAHAVAIVVLVVLVVLCQRLASSETKRRDRSIDRGAFLPCVRSPHGMFLSLRCACSQTTRALVDTHVL